MLLLPLAHATEWHALSSAEAHATSFLHASGSRYEENYHPNYAFDDDPVTAWVEGVEGDGAGQSIEWPISGLASARTIRVDVRDGYQKSATLFAANGAPKDIRVEVLDPAGNPVAHTDATLAHAMDWQTVTVPLPAGRPINAVRLTVLTAWPGTKYKDTCISDLRTFVDSDVAYDAAFEAQKHATLLAWRAARMKTAAWYATHAAESPWQTATWDGTSTGSTTAALEPLFATVRPLRAQLAALPTWWSASTRGAAPTPEALGTGDGGLPMVPVLAKDLVLYEASGAQARRTGDPGDRIDDTEERFGWWDQRESNRHVEWADSAHTAPRRLAWKVTYRSDGREVSDTNVEYVAEYDDHGQLARVYTFKEEHGDESCWEQVERMWTYTWDAASHLTRVTRAETRLYGVRPAYNGATCTPSDGGGDITVYTPAPPSP